MAFPSQKQECFFYAHTQAFQYFGGVPARLTYDNLATAVKLAFDAESAADPKGVDGSSTTSWLCVATISLTHISVPLARPMRRVVLSTGSDM